MFTYAHQGVIPIGRNGMVEKVQVRFLGTRNCHEMIHQSVHQNLIKKISPTGQCFFITTRSQNPQTLPPA